jgi:DNA-binding transcriptional LysR family regulator
LASLRELREKPAGNIRITIGEHVAESILWPALGKLLPKYPDIKVELVIDYGLTDIVAERYDAGVRLGEQIAKDMIAVRIGPDMRMAVVAAPSYFAKRSRPKRPQDLTAYTCINLRLPTYGSVYAWEFEKNGREVKVHVEGQVTFNNLALRLKATLAGHGLAYLPEDQVRTHISEGRLVRVLADWCPKFPGYHLYYPSRRQATPGLPRAGGCAPLPKINRFINPVSRSAGPLVALNGQANSAVEWSLLDQRRTLARIGGDFLGRE